uniref:Putative bovine pancreatic trypsin inhibitor n=1 Tax=Rhipicephalus microplus TaxID=6941 RepID=A0A6G5A7B2_RHIMP
MPVVAECVFSRAVTTHSTQKPMKTGKRMLMSSRQAFTAIAIIGSHSAIQKSRPVLANRRRITATKLLFCFVVASSCLVQVNAVRGFIYQHCITEVAVQTCKEHAKDWGVDFLTRTCKLFYEYKCNTTSATTSSTKVTTMYRRKSFPTEANCQQQCLPPQRRSVLCSVTPKPGPCPPMKQTWYFDQTSGFCKRYPPGTCGASANRFSLCETCTWRCTDRNIQTACPRFSVVPPPGQYPHSRPGAQGHL